MKSFLLLAAAAGLAHGQIFEVASIKPAPPPDPGAGMRVSSRGGPGSNDPGMWTCENMSLSNIVSNAFDLHANQLNAPSWMDQQRFNITAKIPAGATREQFRQMLQNLLVERFGLKFHREKKEVAGYEVVLGKNGPKFKENVPAPPPDPAAEGGGVRARPAAPTGPNLGPDGYPVLRPGGGNSMTIMRDRARAQWIGVTMENFATNIAYQVGKPVVDGTGLPGKYDLYLFWIPRSMSAGAPAGAGEAVPVASEPAGPDLFTALQEQLGLKLDPKKVTIDVLVVDHAEKAPTDN